MKNAVPLVSLKFFSHFLNVAIPKGLIFKCIKIHPFHFASYLSIDCNDIDFVLTNFVIAYQVSERRNHFKLASEIRQILRNTQTRLKLANFQRLTF